LFVKWITYSKTIVLGIQDFRNLMTHFMVYDSETYARKPYWSQILPCFNPNMSCIRDAKHLTGIKTTMMESLVGYEKEDHVAVLKYFIVPYNATCIRCGNVAHLLKDVTDESLLTLFSGIITEGYTIFRLNTVRQLISCWPIEKRMSVWTQLFHTGRAQRHVVGHWYNLAGLLRQFNKAVECLAVLTDLQTAGFKFTFNCVSEVCQLLEQIPKESMKDRIEDGYNIYPFVKSLTDTIKYSCERLSLPQDCFTQMMQVVKDYYPGNEIFEECYSSDSVTFSSPLVVSTKRKAAKIMEPSVQGLFLPEGLVDTKVKTCVNCLARISCVLFDTCGHVSTCITCTKTLLEGPAKKIKCSVCSIESTSFHGVKGT